MSTSSAPHSVSGPASTAAGVRLKTQSTSDKVCVQERQHMVHCAREREREKEREREIDREREREI